MTSTRRRRPFDSQNRRHTLSFGDLTASLTDADVAQLHDSIRRLHTFPDETVRTLCSDLRGLLEDDPAAAATLELDRAGARQVQLAVFAEQSCRRRVSTALADARVQAFRFLEAS